MNVNRLLSSIACFKVVKFFDDNPRIIDTSKGVATFTGLTVATTKNILEQLTKAKILTEHRTPSTVGYSYTADRAMLKKLAAILKRKAKEFSS
ncbi:MAG: hypothetical protein ABIH01_04245 [Candidatus Omnitrophota bacterium]